MRNLLRVSRMGIATGVVTNAVMAAAISLASSHALAAAACDLRSSNGEIDECVAALDRPIRTRCSQDKLEGEVAGDSKFYIKPKHRVDPFYQWDANGGYCGEVSVMQAGLQNGQWTSQYNARLLCGSGLGQSGGPKDCREHKDKHGQPMYNYNAQMSMHSSDLEKSVKFASGIDCLRNFGLAAVEYPAQNQKPGIGGFQHYMSWVKQQVQQGSTVIVGIAMNSGPANPNNKFFDPGESEDDHIVTVTRIGTRHNPKDPKFYPDDVLYFDDHGETGYKKGIGVEVEHPPEKPRGLQAGHCAVYEFRYPFDKLSGTREQANAQDALLYQFILPTNAPNIKTQHGGDGYEFIPIQPRNHALAVTGPDDPNHVLQPVTLSIEKAWDAKGHLLAADSTVGNNYEYPVIHTCKDARPAPMKMRFKASCENLQPGMKYKMYEYEFKKIAGVGSAAKLDIPTGDFEKSKNLVKSWPFQAKTSAHAVTVDGRSDSTLVFRCVPAPSGG